LRGLQERLGFRSEQAPHGLDRRGVEHEPLRLFNSVGCPGELTGDGRVQTLSAARFQELIGQGGDCDTLQD
jgi:hypothetical protein